MNHFDFQRPAGSAALGVAGGQVGANVAARRLAGRFTPWQWGIIIIPTILAALYFFVIASNQYMSEARFIVRSQEKSTPTMLGSLLQSAGLQRSSDDAYAVQSFMTSRDAIQSLDRNDHLRDIFARDNADFVTRFPGLVSGSSFEALYQHSKQFIDVDVDSSTGVITLQVRAYRPEDAQAMAQAMLRYSEQMVNNLNARAQGDAVVQARKQVDEAESKLADVQRQLTSYRVDKGVLDPKLDSSSLYTTLSGIMGARIVAATQLAEMIKNSPSNPGISGLKTRVTALDSQLGEAMHRSTGGSNSIAGKMGEYERLSLSEDIASKMLAAATQSLETAEADVQSKHLYIEHIAEPNLPDYAIYPRRLLDFGIAFICFMVFYGICWLMLAGVREHAAA